MNAPIRPVVQVVRSRRQLEGAGFVVRRPFPGRELAQADPFLMLDEMGPASYAPGEARGAPDHPHRGFETVTYLVDGEFEHEDSAGHRGLLRAGDVQWMTAGRGVIHSEMPSRNVRERGGRVHGFQLWVNLPARDKMIAPRYQEIPREQIPQATTADGLATVRVIAGAALGAAAVIETRTPIAYHHWTLRPGADVTTALPQEFAAFVYLFSGTGRVGGTEVGDGQLAILGEGAAVRLQVPREATEPVELLLLAGAPLREPVVAYGPFVMNTREQIVQAIDDYNSGKMGEIAR